MKKDDDSSVSIKQILFTTLFLAVATFGGISTYRIVSENTINNIQSAAMDTKDYESALVENTEDDVVYSENLKFMAGTIIGESISDSNVDLVQNDEEEEFNYSEKVISRGNFIREHVASGDSEKSSNKLLDAVLNGIKQIDGPEEILENMVTGLKEDNNQKVEENNQETKNEEIKSEEIKVEETIVEETKTEEPIGVPTEYLRTIDVKATAYCLCKKCCGKSASHPSYGVTASGLKITPGVGMKVVASDPKVIPLGTNVYIEGLYGAKDYGYAVVADTGSAIKNLKIDLYMDTHQMALNWGVKTVRVYILEK